jgi:hypothetical protein
MHLKRYVPLEGALMAAGKVFDTATTEECEAFREWFNTQPVRTGRVIDYPALFIDEVEDVLPTVPDTAIGRAWKQVVEKSLADTVAGAPRGYDLATFDAAEELAVIAELDAFAEELREISPMLDEVASAIEMLADSGPTSLGDLREERTRVRKDDIVVGALESSCEKHTECIEGHVLRTIRWEHIDAVAAGGQTGATRDRLVRLLAALDVNLPAA